MFCVPTALLLHTTATGRHHDWLLGDPDHWLEPGARLWTARVEPASSEWACCARFSLTPLPPHRARYLRYEGPISGNRGRVRRVDAGYALISSWRMTPQPTRTKVEQGHLPPADGIVRATLAVRMRHFAGWIALIEGTREQWTAQVLASDPPQSPGR